MIQSLVNGVYAGSQYALVAVGLTLIYSVARFLNFAHGATYAIGAYAVFCLAQAGVPLVGAAALGILVAAAAGAVAEWGIYRRFRDGGAGPLVVLLASLGVFVGVQGVLAVVFGESVKMIRSGPVVVGESILGARLTRIQMVGVLGSILLCGITYAGLRFSAFGKQARAIASDLELAKSVGINTNGVTLLTMIIASILAGFAGIAGAYDVDLRPTMGFYPLLMGVVAMLVGGVGHPIGAIGAALFIALIQQTAVAYLPTQWQDAIIFLILILLLLLRPQGFLGKPLRRAAV